MDQLLNPNFGVLALTIVNFLLLVWLLHKFTWKPIIGALEKREQQIAQDKQAAAQARQDAQQLKAELEAKWQQFAHEAAQKMQETVAVGQAQKERLLAETKEQAERLLQQAQAQIQAEKEKALQDVRKQIVQTALLAAAKVTRQQVSPQAAEASVEEVLQHLPAREK